MQFKENEAIYLQIAEHISDSILRKELPKDAKIPSVRELAVSLAVNPNTIMRSYAYLEEKGIIYNQRGIGYFVAKDALDVVMKLKMNEFIERELPQFFKKMALLKISFKDLKELYYKTHTTNGKEITYEAQ